jgi:clan AA aspartic protease (TIGR02281 family)
VEFFDSLAAACPDPMVRKKLVIYTNQLKDGWNRAEPGGISHNPRARKEEPVADAATSRFHLALAVVLLAMAGYVLVSTGVVSVNLGGRQELRVGEAAPVVSDPGRGAVATSAPKEASAPQAPSPPVPQLATEEPAQAGGPSAPASYYSYSDDQGVVHMVSDPDAVPRRYRSRMRAMEAPSRQHSTPVVIRGNRVLVPVTFSYRGRTVTATLLLDTGATTTTVSEALASRLGVASGDVQQGRARLADGRYVDAYAFTLDSLTVGDRSQSQVQATCLAGSGGGDHDGLLGMNFLRNYRYHIDFNRNVIEWGN